METIDIVPILQRDQQRVISIIVNEIQKNQYIKPDNFFKNIETLKKSIATDHIFGESIALYVAPINTILVDEENYIKNEKLRLIALLHEFIHLMSSDIEKGITGYQCDETHRIFNEAATQWLACKFLGVDLRENVAYSQSVLIFDELVKRFGEERMYNGFFDANIVQFRFGFNKEELEYINQKITEMNRTPEANGLKNMMYNLVRLVQEKNGLTSERTTNEEK